MQKAANQRVTPISTPRSGGEEWHGVSEADNVFQQSTQVTQKTKKPSNRTKITGIAPVFDSSFTIIDAARTGQFGPSPQQIIVPEKKSFWHNQSSATSSTSIFGRLLQNWIIDEIWLVMNKLTLFGLTMGLMFLGSIFFVVGFLSAYKIFPPTDSTAQVTTTTDTTKDTNKSPAQKIFSSVGNIAASVVGSQVEDAAVSATGAAFGVINKVQQKIPAPLQAFANPVVSGLGRKTDSVTQHITDSSERNVRLAFRGQAAQPQNQSQNVMARQGVSPQGINQQGTPQNYPQSYAGQQQQNYPSQGNGSPQYYGQAYPSQGYQNQQGYYQGQNQNPSYPQQSYAGQQPYSNQSYPNQASYAQPPYPAQYSQGYSQNYPQGYAQGYSPQAPYPQQPQQNYSQPRTPGNRQNHYRSPMQQETYLVTPPALYQQEERQPQGYPSPQGYTPSYPNNYQGYGRLQR